MAEAITEATVDLNGVRLYTRRVGHGPPLVVLHGGPGAHHDYLLPQYDHLAEGGRALLSYDQRAAGGAPGPPAGPGKCPRFGSPSARVRRCGRVWGVTTCASGSSSPSRTAPLPGRCCCTACTTPCLSKPPVKRRPCSPRG